MGQGKNGLHTLGNTTNGNNDGSEQGLLLLPKTKKILEKQERVQLLPKQNRKKEIKRKMDVSKYGSRENGYEETPLLNTGVFIDMNSTEADVIIENAREADINGEQKLVLDVKVFGKQYGWIMNKVNTNTLIEKHGVESDKWIDKHVLVALEKTDYEGRRINCLRIQ